MKYILAFLVSGLIVMSGCIDPTVDFGYDAQLSGKVIDVNGNIVSGDTKVTTYSVQALGEKDIVPMVLRVKGDGTFAHTKLYPQKYKVWLIGPIVGAQTDTVLIDLTGFSRQVIKDFEVTPLLTIPAPVLNGTPSPTEIKVNYQILGNQGRTPNLREIICSNITWPTRTTGTGGMGYFTRIVTVSANQGTATITGLTPNTKYYIRVGARAAGQTLFNHSEQIVVTTPAN